MPSRKCGASAHFETEGAAWPQGSIQPRGRLLYLEGTLTNEETRMLRGRRPSLLAGLLLAAGGLAAPAAHAATRADSTTDAIGRETPWPVTVQDGDTALTV